MSALKSLTEYNFLIQRGDFSASRLLDEVVSNVEANEDKINAYINLFTEQAIGQARAIDDSGAEPDERKPLAGIPIAVKDNILVKGKPCTCASRILEGFRAPYNATVIERLLDAGAVIVGKTNMDEFAMGSSNENSAYGPVANPLDLERVPGGSSGGSAAAVAYGGAVAALGTDTGGSARQPAAFCGLVGFRPTYGRVSRYGLVAFASSLDQICPITRTVEDAAVLYSVIAGPDDADSTTSPYEIEDMDLTGEFKPDTRVGIIKECFEDVADEMREAVLKPLREKGVELVEVSLPLIKLSVAAYQILAMAEASSNLARYDGIRYGLREEKLDLRDTYAATRQKGFGEEVKRRILVGTFGLSEGYIDAYYNTALSYRAALANQFEAAFSTVDFLLSPTAPTPAFKLGEKLADPLSMYLSDIFTAPAALAALPAISIPSPSKVEGLPVGIQLSAPRWEDAKLLEFAHALEQ